MLLDESLVKQIATRFLEQYHDNVLTKDVTLENNTYLITLVTGMVEKKTVQVKIDAKSTHIIGVSYPVNFEKIADLVLKIANEIRYVLIVSSRGKPFYGKMAHGKTILIKSEEQITNLPTDLHILGQLLKIFDESLGKTSFIHFEREKIHILVFYIRDLAFCVTCERSLGAHEIADISNKIRLVIEKNTDTY